MHEVAVLQDELTAAARSAFTALRRQHHDALCGFALYSDSDGGTVCVAVETRAHMATLDPQTSWSPPEWAHEGVASSYFDDLHDKLDETDRDTDFAGYRDAVWEMCVRALEALLADGTLPAADRVVTFVVSDDLIGAEEDWERRLNPPGSLLRGLADIGRHG